MGIRVNHQKPIHADALLQMSIIKPDYSLSRDLIRFGYNRRQHGTQMEFRKDIRVKQLLSKQNNNVHMKIQIFTQKMKPDFSIIT